MTQDWKDSLARCHDGPSLLVWINDRLARWSFTEIAALPEACRPRRVREVSDIAHWHAVLTESYCGGGALGPNAEVHDRMLQLFAAAIARARELRLARASDEDTVAA